MNQPDCPPPARATPPPLTIRQVMLWTAITAAIMGLVRWFDRQQEGVNSMHFWSVGSAILWGPALGTLVSWPFWRRRGHAFPVHGGDWLLLVVAMGAAVVLQALAVTYFDWLEAGDSRGTFSTLNIYIYLLFDATAAAIVLVAYVAATVCVKATAWRIALGLLAGAQLLRTGAAVDRVVNAIGNELNPYANPFVSEGWLQMLSQLVWSSGGIWLATPVILVSTWDLIRRRPMPWTHWLGASVWLMSHALDLWQYMWLTRMRVD